MRFNIHAGHNYHATGANGYLNETKEARKVKDELIKLLNTNGHTAYDCTDEVGKTKSSVLRNIVAKCNAHEVDYDVSIHLNAFNGSAHGVEVLVRADSKAKAIAPKICDSISAEMGYFNRGVKHRADLYVLNQTKAPALLVECCFVDSKSDADKWDAKKCANAIFKGLVGKNPSKSTQPSVNPVVKPTNNPASSGSISVDGKWGQGTTKKAQDVFGTYRDGIVSGQAGNTKKYQINCLESSWKYGSGGSLLIKAIQRKVGAKVDGYCGKETIKGIQRLVGAKVDGYMGKETVSKFQTWLNKQ